MAAIYFWLHVLGQVAPHHSGRPSPPQVAPVSSGAAYYAALDLGTNNCRLLVARRTRRSFRVVDAFSRIVRLGEGLAATGRLSEPAMARTIEALKICADKVEARQVRGARYVATEACRRAENCAQFLARVEGETGLPIEIISSAEEARLVVLGCAPLLDPAVPRAIVIDIGGGSTELAWVALDGDDPPEILAAVSVPLGVVTMTDRYGGREVSAATYEAMVAETRGAVETFDREHGISLSIAAGGVQMLGSSGTVTTLAAVQLGLSRYRRAAVDGFIMAFTDIVGISHLLADLDYPARIAHPCIGPDRADLVISGCAILEGVCQVWPVGRLRVADRGIREGVLAGLVAAER
jgi:exopolyphosphatase / guanosine-5'-triphosphate,3'-diphosphate pyrophosphatase